MCCQFFPFFSTDSTTIQHFRFSHFCNCFLFKTKHQACFFGSIRRLLIMADQLKPKMVVHCVLIEYFRRDNWYLLLPNHVTSVIQVSIYPGLRSCMHRGTLDRVSYNRDQFWYIKIQPKPLDLRARLWEINPTNSEVTSQSLVLRSIF